MMIAVVICTHNPRPEYLQRTLEGLKRQTLAMQEWTLTIVDNLSTPAVDASIVSWHPEGKVVREEELGLTPARLRGIALAAAPFIVFVDDDNVLAPDYLSKVLEISRDHPHLGAWGAGVLEPGFEVPPPEWTKPYWKLVAVGNVGADKWSNLGMGPEVPCGAGLCVRRQVADAYAEKVRNHPLRRRLDRTGTSLLSGGDTDLALTACSLGMGVGNFIRLQLTHLIPAERLEKLYLLRLQRMMAASEVLRRWSEGQNIHRIWPLRILDRCRALALPGLEREFRLASLRGTFEGRRLAQLWSTFSPPAT